MILFIETPETPPAKPPPSPTVYLSRLRHLGLGLSKRDAHHLMQPVDICFPPCACELSTLMFRPCTEGVSDRGRMKNRKPLSLAT